jgi:hypothetical protein
MRALYLLDVAAFAVCLQVPTVALPNCSRVPTLLDRIRMAVVADDVCRIRTFQGSLYGVTATVELDLYSRKANVQLSGVVLGGGLSGTGWLESADGDKGTVVLDDNLATALAWRRVTIVSASLDRETDSVTICATIPILGFQKIVLSVVNGK